MLAGYLYQSRTNYFAMILTSEVITTSIRTITPEAVLGVIICLAQATIQTNWGCQITF